MASNDTGMQAEDAARRNRGAWAVAILVFMVTFTIFVICGDHWGLAVGWLPSGIVAAAFGWIAYCFPWIADLVAILLEVIVAGIG